MTYDTALLLQQIAAAAFVVGVLAWCGWLVFANARDRRKHEAELARWMRRAEEGSRPRRAPLVTDSERGRA